MGFLYLFLSILGESSGKTIDKFNFRRNRVNPRQLLFIVFYTMTASIFGFIILTKQTFPHISLITLALLIGIAIFSFGGNVFDCLSLKADDLSLREPLVDFEPILTGFLGYLIFPAERKTAFLVAFILGALIVRWGIHRRKLRKFQSKGIYYLWIGVLLYAIVPIFYKEALVHLSPTYIAFFRVSSILLLTSIFFPPKRLKGLSPKMTIYGVLSGLAYAVGAIVSLYAIKVFGVVLTMLFLMLGPALRYYSGKFILREKVRMGEVISSVLLTIVVVVAAIIR